MFPSSDMKRYKCKIWQVYLLPLLALLLGGCSGHADPSLWNSVDKPWDGDLYLKLNVAVAQGGTGIATRAVDGFENPTLEAEKLQTLRVIIVKKEGSGENVTRTIKYNRPYNSLNSLSSDRFKVEFSTDYTIYLIGNEAGLAGLLPLTGEDRSLTPTEFLKKYYSENQEYFDIPDYYRLENLVITAPSSDSPILINNVDKDENEATPIPMTEMFTVTTMSKDVIPSSNAEEVVMTENKTLFITRAATKFSFTFKKGDDLPDNLPENTFPTIKAVKISGLSDTEYLFPNATTYTNINDGREITEFNVPTGSNSSQDFVFNLPEAEQVNIAQLSGEGITYSPQIYFPESKGKSGNPKEAFQCSISYDGEDYLTPVNLDNLPYFLPRNTHVKVNIIIHRATLEISVEVVDWTYAEPLNLVYTETVNVVEKLMWTENTYQRQYVTDTDKECIVVMKEWKTFENGNSECIPLEGEFTIESPIGAKWSAYLLQTADQGGEAFAFQDIDASGNFLFEEDGDDEAGGMDGDDDEAEEMGGGLSGGDLSGGDQTLPVTKTPKLVSSVSGIISGNESTKLKIYTKQNKPIGNVANRAILQILVTINNGGMVSVFEAPVNPDGISKFIIVQNP